MPAVDRIASHYFCRAETLELRSIKEIEPKLTAFFRCWTRKEAYIKAVGDGLHLALNQFQVTLLPDEPARFVHIGMNAVTASAWTLKHFDPAPGYVGALACNAGALNIVFGPLDRQALLDGIGCLEGRR